MTGLEKAVLYKWKLQQQICADLRRGHVRYAEDERQALRDLAQMASHPVARAAAWRALSVQRYPTPATIVRLPTTQRTPARAVVSKATRRRRAAP